MDDGVSVGLRFCLIFLLAFYLLGYSAPLSISLGVIGAIAGGYIASQKMGKPRPPQPPSDKKRENPFKFARTRFASLGKRQQDIEKRVADIAARTRRRRTFKSRR